MWYIYTMKYYTTGKKINDILKFASKWMKLENIIMSELTHPEIQFIICTLGVEGPSVFVLLSLVNKETALGLVIPQNLGRRGGRTEFWEEESRVGEPPWS